jgi:hypothetical protein
MGKACSTNGEAEYTKSIGGKAAGKETNRREKRRWVDNIKIDLGEIEGG